jgi:TonB family protein
LLSLGLLPFADASGILTPVLQSSPAVALTIVTPKFPAAHTVPAEGVRVDVSGTVLPAGNFQASAVSAPAGLQPFADAVVDVLPWWRFVPAVDNKACSAIAQEFAFAVWFEGTANKPRVFVSMPSRRESEPSPLYADLVESISSPEMTYPRRLRRLEGQVRVLMLFGASGNVEVVNVLSSTPYGAFDADVLDHARETTIKWKEPVPASGTCFGRTYNFCHEDGAKSGASLSSCR